MESPSSKENKKKKEKKEKSKKSEQKAKKEKKEKRKREIEDRIDDASKKSRTEVQKGELQTRRTLQFDHKYILAPMVGASELAFRILCRKYGTQLAYTPMMSSEKFATDEDYRKSEFQTVPEDRPLVCHFEANDPGHFAAAAKLCEHQCDAIDLNLGCPQRTAFVGHFGSYLLGPEDRELLLSIVKAGSQAVSIPIFVKIRLLDTLEETLLLCRQLRDAGASLIAVHARYRATFHRNGPGARDGPAIMDQIEAIKRVITDIPIIANGNVITYDDVENNLALTKADGVMSAEGILDNPALFLPRLGSRNEPSKKIEIANPSFLPGVAVAVADSGDKKKRKVLKKLREIEQIEALIKSDGGAINEEQRNKLAKKDGVVSDLAKLEEGNTGLFDCMPATTKPKTETTTLGALYAAADDKIALAKEYLQLVRRYPIKSRTIAFHTRRILRDGLTKFQLMEECVACQSVDEVQAVVKRLEQYTKSPETFVFDKNKSARQKEALEAKKREEGKRRAFEGRMMRKAKREGKTDLQHYLRIGAEVPTLETIQRLRKQTKEEQLALWKRDHSQHCMDHHLTDSCKRAKGCSFLHVDATGVNSFVESDEVAG
jgi:tRNA-dihydrouridine synthase 1